MPAKAEYLILVRLALAGIAREVPMSESALADLKLAVTEVCGNVVRHAYGDEAGRGAGRVRRRRRGDRGDRRGRRAPGMALDDVPDAIRLGEEPVEAGMGLAIIRAVVDDLTVDGARTAPGTVVRLKRLSG